MAYVVPRNAGRWEIRESRTTQHGQTTSDNARAAGAWVAASAAERGEALRDLLLLADRLPARRAASRSRFPRVRTTTA